MKKQTFNKILRSVMIVVMASVLMLGSAISVCAAANYPKPDKNVADDAGVLSESTIRSIQKTNETLSKDVGATIAICTVATTGEEDIATYARNIFKEWKLGEGVLLLISEEDENYYFVQSVGVDKVLTNTVLEEVRDNYLEADFAAGNIDRGVSKCVTRLSTLLSAGLEAPKTDENDENPDSSGTPSTDTEQNDDKKGTSIGGVIVGFFKFLLYAVLVLVVLFIVLFVWAMFNDDVAAFMQKYIFRRRNAQYNVPEEYYDDRLYGNSQKNQQNQQRNRAPQQRPQNQQRTRTYYDANGNPVQPRLHNSQNGSSQQYNQQNYRNPQSSSYQQQYNQQNRTQQNQYTGDETRSFTIPGRENRR